MKNQQESLARWVEWEGFVLPKTYHLVNHSGMIVMKLVNIALRKLSKCFNSQDWFTSKFANLFWKNLLFCLRESAMKFTLILFSACCGLLDQFRMVNESFSQPGANEFKSFDWKQSFVLHETRAQSRKKKRKFRSGLLSCHCQTCWYYVVCVWRKIMSKNKCHLGLLRTLLSLLFTIVSAWRSTHCLNL